MTHRSAQLHWTEDGLPLSSDFEDSYFSRHDPVGESQTVFLGSNHLAERFASLRGAPFAIGENGFGTGLNFLLTLEAWSRHTESGLLTFVSTEKFPMTAEDLERAHGLWPALASIAKPLRERLFPLTPGFNLVPFPEHRTWLILLVGDAETLWQSVRGTFDAWFLDGFAPARNSDMWSMPIFTKMRQLSCPGATFGTFTAAGFVRRNLEAAGFVVEKIPGHGGKRHMLRGQAPGCWKPRAKPTGRVAIIGGGLAGCSTALALTQAGIPCDLYEQHEKIASEASGNPAGILHLKPSAYDSPLNQLVLAGYSLSLRLLQLCQGDSTPLWQATGILQLLLSDKDLKRGRALKEAGRLPPDVMQYLDADAASARMGLSTRHPALYFPQGGFVFPSKFCEAMLSAAAVTPLTCHAAKEIAHTTQGFRIQSTSSMTGTYALIVAAAGQHCGLLLPEHPDLSFRRTRGQITAIPATTESRSLQTVVCGHRYLMPDWQGQHWLGATFNPRDTDASVRPEDHKENLEQLNTMLPAFTRAAGTDRLVPDQLDGRTGFRCSLPDLIPVLGVDKHSGLWLNAAHGSRGLISAPLCGFVLAAQLLETPLPVSATLADALEPDRFSRRKA